MIGRDGRPAVATGLVPFRSCAVSLMRSTSCAIIAVVLAFAPVSRRAGSPVSLRNDVMAVLSEAGCNAGACHGNHNGKGGFKLSLRGQDPDVDYAALTRDLFARRVNPIDPDQSLILLKPTGQLAHEGGKRFAIGFDSNTASCGNGSRRACRATAPRCPALQRLEVTPRSEVLVEPADRVQITATAVFSDGIAARRVEPGGVRAVDRPGEDLAGRAGASGSATARDDRHRALSATASRPVRLAFVPARPDFVWQAVAGATITSTSRSSRSCRTLRMNPSEPCTRRRVLRRAYLDLLGILPTAEEARAFVADHSPRTSAAS